MLSQSLAAHRNKAPTRGSPKSSARRGQVLPAIHREVLPVMSTLLRSGTPCPRLTSLDKLRQGSLLPDPGLTDLCDGTEANDTP